MNIKCENEKYEWCFDEKSGKLTCKRYGEKWRDETGDGAILALIQEAESLQERITKAQNCLVCAASPSADAFEICNTTYEILKAQPN